MRFTSSGTTRLLAAFILASSVTVALPGEASGQYFGRNKVQFEDFDFRTLELDHFDLYFYGDDPEPIEDAARMAERWYERYARTFQHEFEKSKPLILYRNHPDFQQTNTLRGNIGGGTGGVTESLKNRVIMPLTGSYWDTDHVLGHELVHAFQYNIAQSRRGGGLQSLSGLPLWLVEGMAEYLSVGRTDPLTAMWMRDAIRRDEFPTIQQMTNDSRFFPYRFGQALWAYIGGTYGDDAVIQIYRRSLRGGFQSAVRQVIGQTADTLSARWKKQVEEDYMPVIEGREAPSEQGNLILAPSTGSGSVNISPSISPDGRFVAFLSEKDLFSVDLFLANAETGEIVRKLSSANSDPHIEALRYIDSSGTWSPDSRFFAYSVTAGGDNRIVIVDAESGSIERRIDPGMNIGSLTNPSWSPDGRYIAFSGMVDGISDLFVFDLETGTTERLTQDKYADLQPSWSPDGQNIVFTTDRGPETDFEELTYSAFQLATIDVGTREVTAIPVFGNVKHINPQYSADGSELYFISDRDGVSDIYALDLQNGDVRRITNLATGVSGHTYASPAMSVARSGLAAYTVFDEMEFHVYTRSMDEGTVVASVDENVDFPGRRLPPVNPDRFSRIETYLADADTGLYPSGTFDASEEAEDYDSSLSLDYVGQPSIGVGTDNFGNYASGGASAYFSDMLGNRVLGVQIQAQGTFKDIGGQAFYTDLSDRWNWGVGGGRIPYRLGFYEFNEDELGPYIGQTQFRIFNTSITGQLSYPFSSTRRVEFGLGATRYSYDVQVDKFYVDQFNRVIHFEREDRNDQAPDPLNMAEASAALVGDNAFFGFVSPVRGGRYRLEAQQTLGDVDFTTLIADWRRYFAPNRNLTIGVRGMHYGRYGLEPEGPSQDGFGILNPLFLGHETLVRGYAWESFQSSECEASSTAENTCPTLNRLRGQRIGVANLELRVPFIGVEEYGIINFPFLPTELVAFADAGLAWNSNDEFNLEFSRSSTDRIPVMSTGVSARSNILGFLILEAYYAYPWQRPDKGWHWGFQIAPGW
ncbi:MAG: peptidase S9 [Gemmatimonadota bacterium]|nr:peptidase S9 [Gemmatimonadota bacterium]